MLNIVCENEKYNLCKTVLKQIAATVGDTSSIVPRHISYELDGVHRDWRLEYVRAAQGQSSYLRITLNHQAEEYEFEVIPFKTEIHNLLPISSFSELMLAYQCLGSLVISTLDDMAARKASLTQFKLNDRVQHYVLDLFASYCGSSLGRSRCFCELLNGRAHRLIKSEKGIINLTAMRGPSRLISGRSGKHTKKN